MESKSIFLLNHRFLARLIPVGKDLVKLIVILAVLFVRPSDLGCGCAINTIPPFHGGGPYSAVVV